MDTRRVMHACVVMGRWLSSGALVVALLGCDPGAQLVLDLRSDLVGGIEVDGAMRSARSATIEIRIVLSSF